MIAYENYLNDKKYTGNNLITNQQKFNNVIDSMLAELAVIKTSSCFDVTIGYAKDDKGKIIRDITYGGLTRADGNNSIKVEIYKGAGGVDNYSLLAHELTHVYRYFTGDLIPGDTSSYTKEDEYEAYKRQQILLRKADYFDNPDKYNKMAFDDVNNNYSGGYNNGYENFPTLQWGGVPPFGSTGSGNDSTGVYGSSGLNSTGYDNDVYWEHYYVYEENGPYTPGDGPWQYAELNYSTGYNFIHQDISDIQHKINRRPRKKLGYDNPKHIFYTNLEAKVALAS